MALGSQFLESKHWCCDHVTQGIQKQRLALPAIETEFHFREISRQMLCADTVPRSNDAALQERERRLNRVRMNVTVNVNLGLVLDRLVFFSERGFAEGRGIGVQLIRHKYFDILTDVLSDILSQRSGLDILRVKKSQIAATLPDADNDLFVGVSVSGLAVGVLPSAEIGFINFNGAVHHGAINFFHGSADAMAEVPCRFVRAFVLPPDRALELQCAHALLGFAEQERSKKPLLQGEMGVIEDCASGDGELIVAFLAVEELFRRLQFHDRALAAQAFRPIRPAQADQQFAAPFVRIEKVYNVN